MLEFRKIWKSMIHIFFTIIIIAGTLSVALFTPAKDILINIIYPEFKILSKNMTLMENNFTKMANNVNEIQKNIQIQKRIFLGKEFIAEFLKLRRRGEIENIHSFFEQKYGNIRKVTKSALYDQDKKMLYLEFIASRKSWQIGAIFENITDTVYINLRNVDPILVIDDSSYHIDLYLNYDNKEYVSKKLIIVEDIE